MNIEYEKDNKERIPFEHYLEEYRKLDPLEVSSRTGIPYDKEQQCFTIRLMQKSYRIKMCIRDSSWRCCRTYEIHIRACSGIC